MILYIINVEKAMYFLYYNSKEVKLELTDTIKNSRGLELLETNSVLEKILIRTEMYEKQYRCVIDNQVDEKPNHWVTKRIKRSGPIRRSEETKLKMSKATSGEGNS